MMVDGKIYTIPSLNLITISQGITVRKDLIKKYNISSINDLDDLEKYLASVKEDDKSITPLKAVPLNTGFYARLYGYVCFHDYTNLVYKYDDLKMKLIPWEATPAFEDLM